MATLITAVAATVLISLGGGPPPPPPSIDVDSPAAVALFEGLRESGIAFSRPEQVVSAAQAVCRLGAEGKSDEEILGNVAENNRGLTEEDVTTFATLARQSYCPPDAPPAP